MPTNCYECDAALTGPVCKICNVAEKESTAWWAEFIEHWAARGVNRRLLNDAVVKFRQAQSDLSAALRKST